MEIHELAKLEPTMDRIYREVAEKHNLKPSDIKKIWERQFEFMRYRIEHDVDYDNDKYPSFLLQFFIEVTPSLKSKLARTKKAIFAIRKLRQEGKYGSNRTKRNKQSTDGESGNVCTGTDKEDCGQGQEQG